MRLAVPGLATTCVLLLLSLPPLEAQKTALDRQTVTLRDSDIPVSKALAELQRQTGVAVTDERGVADASIRLDLEGASFWQAVDTIAAAAKAKAVPSRDGGVRLVRLRPGEQRPPTHYEGNFRARVLRVTTTHDLESNEARCQVQLELAWTPTLRPLFLDSQAHGVRVLDGSNRPLATGDAGSSLSPIEDRGSFTLDVSFAAPPRRDTRLSLLEGKVLAVLPTKFLTFRYDADLAALNDAVADGAVRRLTEEEVTCRIERIVLGKERWSVQVGLDYPPGGKALESFQASSLVANNELVLVSGDGKRRLTPTGYVVDTVSSRRARVTYHFTDRAGARLGAARDWKPRYRAPARIVEVPIGFRFREVPLR